MFAHLTKRTVIGACALLALGACATTTGAQDYGTGPALYVARDADSTMYLYGTIHLRRAGEPWGGAHVDAALNEAETVWTETEINAAAEANAQQAALRLGMAPADQPLSSWLTEDEQARLSALYTRLGLPAGALEPMRPWLASLTLSVIPMLQAGFDPQAGVDRAISAWTQANGREARWFETAEQQIGFFAGLSDEAQKEMLIYSIDEAESAGELVEAMTAAWETGDMQTLEALVIGEMRGDFPEAYEAMFTRRNAAWVDVLTQELAGSGVDFVAVGAGHLVGPESVIEMLRARGVTVERIPAR
ncbi:MAG TPA: TraB/GumN family protein [Terricaulis sp.]|nr:TraB/GumN family protein [Terricaulis sp.]